MTTDDFLACIRDGKPAALEHHVEVRGMGGRGDKAPPTAHDKVPLCRGCHRDLHDALWDFRIEDGMVLLLAPGDPGWVQGRRALVLSESGGDPLGWTDEKLATEWERQEANAIEALHWQCIVAKVFQQRYGWGEKWYEQAARFIADFTGRDLHWRDVYRRRQMYDAFKDRWEDLSRLGIPIAMAVAKSADPKKGLSMALSLKAQNMRPTEIKQLLAGKVARPAKATCVCAECGNEHTKGE